MDNAIFEQMRFVRGQTLKHAAGVPEEKADAVPGGFRNSIRWHLGHIYVVTERFSFQYLGLPKHMPEGFKERFEFGTSPLEWDETTPPPTLPELEKLLSEQVDRVEAALAARLDEEVVPPYVTSAGMKLSTTRQFLSFGLYHEGMHFGILKVYKKLLGI